MTKLLAMAFAGLMAAAAGGCASDVQKDEMMKKEEIMKKETMKKEEMKDSRGM